MSMSNEQVQQETRGKHNLYLNDSMSLSLQWLPILQAVVLNVLNIVCNFSL
jgi:hypothetical protein